MKYQPPLKLSLALLACASFQHPLHGAVIAFEGFDYAEAYGTSVSALDGGTGWTEAYPAPSGTIALDDGLSFSGHLASTGKAMEYGKNANLTTNGRNWSTTVDSGTYWYSMLVNPQTFLNGSTTEYGRGVFNIFQKSGDNQNGFGFRLDNDGTSNPRFKAHSQVQATGANIEFSGGYNQTYLVLGSITVDLTGSTVSSLWVYNSASTLPTAAPDVAMSTVSSATGTLNSAFSGRAFSNSAPIGIDEIRIGTAFADVMSIPEPSTALLGLFGLLSLVRRRR